MFGDSGIGRKLMHSTKSLLKGRSAPPQPAQDLELSGRRFSASGQSL